MNHFSIQGFKWSLFRWVFLQFDETLKEKEAQASETNKNEKDERQRIQKRNKSTTRISTFQETKETAR